VLGADQSLSFDISSSSFDISIPNPPDPKKPNNIDIDKGGVIDFTYSVADGTSTTLINMTVSSTLGNIPSPVILQTDDGGKTFKASVSVTSQFPGKAVVRAAFKDSANKEIVANKTITYVSTTPAKLAIQAVSPTLVPNGQTNIIAKVTDANDNPVSDAVVNFKLENPLGSELDNPSVKTNDKGEAIVSFKAGSGTTGTEKITVKADVLDEKSGVTKTSSLNLTIGGKAVFISIATGNQIEELTTTTYAVPHQITVTDATGAPVANTEVKISVWPVNYYKGVYVFSTEKKLWVPVYSAECSNEDANQNGFLDLWENNGTGVALSPFDYPKGEETDVEDNKDGKLWPGNPVTLSTSTLTTGADGIAYFNVLYGQSYANWLKVKLTAKAQVQGTESKTDRVFGIPASSGDMGDEKVSPPGGTQSVYGTATVCTDPN
ncbi:MAG TPA: Ig-like domain-containing protein, partial [Agitococcus sp.]|nr:Ig-like domain-containing protein [Agitococcus sp.]